MLEGQGPLLAADATAPRLVLAGGTQLHTLIVAPRVDALPRSIADDSRRRLSANSETALTSVGATGFGAAPTARAASASERRANELPDRALRSASARRQGWQESHGRRLGLSSLNSAVRAHLESFFVEQFFGFAFALLRFDFLFEFFRLVFLLLAFFFVLAF